jgi:hypothetical protein
MADKHTHSHHDHGSCTHCGSALRIERAFKVDNAISEALFVSLAESMNLDVYRKGRKSAQTMVVGSTDRETLDRFDLKLNELMAQLAMKVNTIVAEFIQQHMDIDIRTRR